MQIGSYEFVDLVVCIGNPARHLRIGKSIGHVGERLRVVVPGLDLSLGVIDRAAIQSCGSSCFESLDSEAERVK